MVACYKEYCVDAQKQQEIHVILVHVYLALKAVLWGEPFPLQVSLTLCDVIVYVLF